MNLSILVKRVDFRRAKAALAWMPRALQPHGEPRAVPSARPAPFLIVVSFFLLALGGVLLWSAPAEAQDPFKILVANSGHPPESQGPLALDADSPRYAQRFTTGSDAPGYTLDSILIGFYSIADRNTAGSELTATLNEESSDFPGAVLCTLDTPSAFGSFGLHSFSAPNSGMDQCPALRASTTYFAIIERANLNTSTIELNTTSAYGESAHTDEGWSIGDGRHRYVSASTPPWTHSSGSANLFFRVQGVPIPHPPRVTGFDLDSDNDNPKGIWGNHETIWVSQSGTAPRLFAYNRSDDSRDSSKDFTTLSAAGNGAPTGLCSDGTTMFVVDRDDDKVYAYTLSTGARDSTKDITLASGNTKAEGLWCNDDTVWVAEDDVTGSNEIFAYNRADGTQNTDVDFPYLDPEVNGSPLNANPRGTYSNGETMFVVDDEDARVYAWKMSDQTQDSDKEIDLDSDNADPEGLWFDGRVLWVVDDADDRVYVYDLPGAQPDNTVADGVPGVRTPTSEDVWAATLTVGDGRIFGDGYISSITPIVGSLSPEATFTLDGTTYTVTHLYIGAGALAFGLDKEPPREFTLSVGGEPFVSPGRRDDVAGATYGYIWHDVNLSWSISDTLSVVMSVDYAPKKGGELTADVSGIRDSTDGVAKAFFHYQWFRVDGPDETELDGETGPAYTPTDDDVDKHLKVRVIFDDDAGNKEYPLTSPQVGPVGTNSAATGTPAITGAPRAGGMLTVDLSGITDPEGTDAAEFTYQWIRIDGDSEADIPNATRPTYRPTDEDADKQIKVKVSFTDDQGFPEGPLVSEATATIVGANVLVKNTGQTSDGTTRTLTNIRSARAQAFTTGPNTEGYELASIGFLFDDIDNTSVAGSQLTVTLRADSSGDPGNTLCTLSDPSSFTGSGVQTFTAPTSGSNLCPTLAGSTTYFAVMERGAVTSDTISLKTTNESNEDPGSATGWTIGNDRHFLASSSWDKTTSQSHQLEVKGSPAAPPITSEYRTWVDNRRGEAATGYDNTGPFTIAQGFRTGDTVGIFEVDEIHVEFDRGQPATGKIQVRIVESTAPDDFWEFATPSGFWKGGNYNPQTVTTGGVHTFSRASGNSALKANTNYFLVIESTNDDSTDAAIVRMTGHEGEDSDDGWTVDNYSHSKAKQPNATWTKQDQQVRFRISGSFRSGIGMAGDSYAFESCVELRRGELTNCVAAIAVPEPADPENPPENVSRSGLVLDPDLFPEITKWWTGWWQWMHEYIGFPVTMNPLPTGNNYVTMSFGTRDYTAEWGQDYWGGSGSVRFDANSDHTQIVNIRIIDDRVEDSGDYFHFYLFQCRDQSNSSCDHLFTDSSVKGIIYNTEESAEISYLNVSDVTVTEGDGATADFTVSLTAPTTAAVHFDYATEDGTAKDGSDYTGGSGSAFLANGDTSVTISVDIANDDAWTGDRTFTLKISDAVYAAISDDAGTATIRDDDPQALVAQFTNLPSGNHGASSFAFDISFNQSVSTRYLAMQNDAMNATGGEITRAERVNGQRDLWRITVQPDSGADVTIALPATLDCSDTGAICTGGDDPQPLSNSITHTFTGTRLSARFDHNSHHNGADAFNVNLVFSEETDATAGGLKDHALTVQGGSITGVTAKNEDSTRMWTIAVQPTGLGDVTVRLALPTDCDTDGHICTPDGERLSTGLVHGIYGPVQLSVSDAAATEGENAKLTFVITADKLTLDKFQFTYATSDGTATAGKDYTAQARILAYTYGEAPITIEVPVLQDELTEGSETLTLTLSEPSRYLHIKDAAATGTILDAAEETPAPNSAPAGLPVVTGTPETGRTLTADTSAITDPDGLTGVSYQYQWVRTTDGEDADIGGATGSTYTPDNDDAGTTLKVRVTFTDDRANQESLTSLPTVAVARTGDGTIWSADMLVVEYSDISIGAASADLFSNVGGSSELQIRSLWSYIPDDDLRLAFTQGVANADDYTLIVGDLTLEFPAGSSGNGNFKWTNVGIDWQDGDTIAVSIVPTSSLEEAPANTAASGKPTISGTPQVGQELTTDTSAVSDADGTQTSVFNHQWLADDANIKGATGSSYTLNDAEEGKAIKVRVSFTDDRGNAESLTSQATEVVAPPPNRPATGAPSIQGVLQDEQQLSADTVGIADTDGLDAATFTYQWIRVSDGDAADVASATGATYTLTADDVGNSIQLQVSFTDDRGAVESTTSAVTGPVAASAATRKLLWLAAITPEDRDNLGGVFSFDASPQEGSLSPAAFTDGDDTPQVVHLSASFGAATSLAIELTGLPVTKDLSNWRLALHATEIAFADATSSLTSSNPATHRFQWDITGLPVDDSDRWDDGEPFTVTLEEAINLSAAGAPTIDGTAQVHETLTANTAAIADGNGLGDVAYRYQWTAAGTDIDGATGSSLTLTSDQEGDTVQVQVTFTDDDGFSETLTSAVTDAVAAAPAAANNPATGAPTISGTPQVEQTLTADTSPIADQDGLTNVSYGYQWIAGGADIYGATGSSFTLAASQQGKTIQVRVSFSDDAGNPEAMTSAATTTVAAKPAPLTAIFSDMPAAHPGSWFEFSLTFSEEVKVSYTTLRDDAFAVTGGQVTKAVRKQKGSNIRWTIRVKPEGNDPVSVTLPETTDCDDDDAICTKDGRMLSHSTSATIDGTQ